MSVCLYLCQVCPVCAAYPGGEPNHVIDDLAAHLMLEHRTSNNDIISFLDSVSRDLANLAGCYTGICIIGVSCIIIRMCFEPEVE